MQAYDHFGIALSLPPKYSCRWGVFLHGSGDQADQNDLARTAADLDAVGTACSRQGSALRISSRYISSVRSQS